MTNDGSAAVLGLSIDDAANTVLARDGAPDDRETVRAALETVATDGVVGTEGIQRRLSEVAKAVSTPETRLEFASAAVADALEAADDADDLGTVRSRAADLEARRDRLAKRVEELGARLDDVVERARAPDDVFALAGDLKTLESAADQAHAAAEDLKTDAESFQRWLASPRRRRDAFAEDLEAVAQSLDGVEDSVATIEDGGSGATTGDGEPSPGEVWFDAALRVRMVDLTLADLSAELADLRAMGGDGNTDGGLADLADRLADLRERRARLADRVEAAARSEWESRYGAAIGRFADELADAEPPVDWDRIRSSFREQWDAGTRG